MKGSIRFDNDINIEVDVDKSAEEGAKLISAVNLVDGQELGGGGGNYKEVITGTAAAPFGDYVLADLKADLIAGNISMMMSIDATALSAGTITGPIYAEESSLLYMDGAYFPNDSTLAQAYAAFWDPSDDMPYLVMYAGGTVVNATTYMSAMSSVLTIYHHPMPEE